MDSKILVHPLTNNPTTAWKEISKSQKLLKLNVKIPVNPVEPNKVRFVCMSDTHSLIRNIMFDVPDGDIFIHAGDFTKCGQREEVIQFNNWLGSLPHKYKIVIAGNHELSFDKRFADIFKKKALSRNTEPIEDEVPNYGKTKDNIGDAVNTENIRQYLTNCIYLEDSGVELYGIKIYGSPWFIQVVGEGLRRNSRVFRTRANNFERWSDNEFFQRFRITKDTAHNLLNEIDMPDPLIKRQPEFGNWAFNLTRGEECLSKWNLIPDDTEVLVTHTPPLGHGDLVCSGVRAGCVELLNTVQNRIKPKYHIFGHIHEGYGVTSDGRIIFINASTCDINYIPNNLPVVFDIPLKEGYSKSG